MHAHSYIVDIDFLPSVQQNSLLRRIIKFKCFGGNCIISGFACFNGALFYSACSELTAMAFSFLMSLVQDYLHSLGKARTAQVQKDARIGEAQYKRDAVIRVNYEMRSLLYRTCLCLVNNGTHHFLGMNDNFDLFQFSLQEAHAMQEKVSAQYVNEIEMAKAQRDFELKKAAYDVEVNTKKAESEMAYQLQVQSPALHLFRKYP